MRSPRWSWRRLRNRLAASPRFQAWAARTPGAAWMARRDGERLFDLIAGFTYSQTLLALVELGVLESLRDGPASAARLSGPAGLAEGRMAALCRAGVALGVMEPAKGGFALSRMGAALLGAPGLTDMIRHHRALYRDLADPVAVLRGGTETELARFWPYVHGAAAAENPEEAARYSDLMSRSQAMVAADTLRLIDLSGVERLMDVGGGAGAFLAAAGARHPGLGLILFDLPAVAPLAARRFREAGLSGRADIICGSFRDDPLPEGADAISLVRVLYDHEDATVRTLLAAVHGALPPGGRVIVSEPMTGGPAPHRPGDVYFTLYCMAMGTGRARSAAEISALLAEAGFTGVTAPRPRRSFVTSVVTGVKST